MNDLAARRRALVEAARAAEPVAADRARVRAALAARLGAAVLAPQSPPPAPPPAAAPLAASAGAATGAKLLVAGALAGALALGGGLLASRSRSLVSPAAVQTTAVTQQPPPSPPSPPAALDPPPPGEEAPEIAPAGSAARRRLLPPAPVPPAMAPPAPAPPAPAPPLVATSAAAEAPVPASLLEETALLRRAQTALGAGDAAAAIARLDELAARHPDGRLREERLAARVLALCAAGREAEARREAERFFAETPRSIQASRVRRSCAFGGGGGSR